MDLEALKEKTLSLREGFRKAESDVRAGKNRKPEARSTDRASRRARIFVKCPPLEPKVCTDPALYTTFKDIIIGNALKLLPDYKPYLETSWASWDGSVGKDCRDSLDLVQISQAMKILDEVLEFTESEEGVQSRQSMKEPSATAQETRKEAKSANEPSQFSAKVSPPTEPKRSLAFVKGNGLPTKIIAYCTECGRSQGTYKNESEMRLRVAELKKCERCGAEFGFLSDGRIWNLRWEAVPLEESDVECSENVSRPLQTSSTPSTRNVSATEPEVSAFLSASFSDDNDEIVAWFRRMCDSLGIRTVWLKDRYEARPGKEKIESHIGECDAFIQIITSDVVREGKEAGWLGNEIAWANKSKPANCIAVFVEKGCKATGLASQVADNLLFDRSNLHETAPSIVVYLRDLKSRALAKRGTTGSPEEKHGSRENALMGEAFTEESLKVGEQKEQKERKWELLKHSRHLVNRGLKRWFELEEDMFFTTGPGYGVVEDTVLGKVVHSGREFKAVDPSDPPLIKPRVLEDCKQHLMSPEYSHIWKLWEDAKRLSRECNERVLSLLKRIRGQALNLVEEAMPKLPQWDGYHPEPSRYYVLDNIASATYWDARNRLLGESTSHLFARDDQSDFFRVGPRLAGSTAREERELFMKTMEPIRKEETTSEEIDSIRRDIEKTRRTVEAFKEQINSIVEGIEIDQPLLGKCNDCP